MTFRFARFLLASLALLAMGGGTATAQDASPEPLSPVPAQVYELRGPGLFITVEAPAIADTDVLPNMHIEYTYYPDWVDNVPSIEVPIFFEFDGAPEQMQPFPAEGGNGWLLTVMVEAIADAQTVTLTLLLPAVNLTGTDVEISTVAIITTHRTSIAGPALVEGPLQYYELVPLTGTVSEAGP